MQQDDIRLLSAEMEKRIKMEILPESEKTRVEHLTGDRGLNNFYALCCCSFLREKKKKKTMNQLNLYTCKGRKYTFYVGGCQTAVSRVLPVSKLFTQRMVEGSKANERCGPVILVLKLGDNSMQRDIVSLSHTSCELFNRVGLEMFILFQLVLHEKI